MSLPRRARFVASRAEFLAGVSSLRSIVIFCQDVYAMGLFWSAALGMGPVEDDAARLAARTLAPGESVLLRAQGRPDVWVSPVERLDPRGNRVHLDLVGDAEDVERLVGLGALHLRDQEEWTVLADPEGNEICVVPGRAGS